MSRLGLYCLVFISGGAVLALEILGTRILGPFYGVSLFLWSALISVTLLALSAGYALGGRWADRGPRSGRLYSLLAGAGIWVLTIHWLKRPVLLLTEPFGLRPAVLVAAFILFAPPLMLLGMVSPYAVRLRATRLEVVGRSAGDLYAVSTVGSVVAALLTGFILIPNVGVSRLTSSIGLVLLLTAAAGFLLGGRGARKGAAGWLLLLLAASSGVIGLNRGENAEGRLIAVQQSPYAEIRVVDFEDRRYLLIDGGVHTIVDPSTFESHFPYTAVLGLIDHFMDEPGELLLIGLGGGSVAKDFSARGWRVEAVEIDPVVISMARRHFGLDESDGAFFEAEGKAFLRQASKLYDLIVMDAFGSSSIPFHLVTVESFELIASKLARGGIFALNLESGGWEGKIVSSLAQTLDRVFENVTVLPAHGQPDGLGNLIVMASHKPAELSRPLQRNFARRDERYRIFAWDNRFFPVGEGQVLTDDLNPVEIAEAMPPWRRRCSSTSQAASSASSPFRRR